MRIAQCLIPSNFVTVHSRILKKWMLCGRITNKIWLWVLSKICGRYELILIILHSNNSFHRERRHDNLAAIVIIIWSLLSLLTVAYLSLFRGSMIYSWAEKEETVEDLASQVCERINLQTINQSMHLLLLLTNQSIILLEESTYSIIFQPNIQIITLLLSMWEINSSNH